MASTAARSRRPHRITMLVNRRKPRSYHHMAAHGNRHAIKRYGRARWLIEYEYTARVER